MTVHSMGEEELQLLDDQARAALEAAAPHRAFATGTADVDALALDHWKIARDLGWPGMLLLEAEGGLGLGLDAVARIAARMGEHLFCGPFLSTAVFGTSLVRAADAHKRFPGLAVAIARGDVRLAIAGLGGDGRFVSDAPTLQYEPQADGVRIKGRRELVEHAAIATHVLALDLSRNGKTVRLQAALMPSDSDLALEPRQGLDITTPVSAIGFICAQVPEADVFETELSAGELDAFLRPVDVVIAAELTGLARGALDRSVAHAKERKQFGTTIGAFQAVKHRLADGHVRLANAELAVRQATTGDNGFSARAARLIASEAALRVCGDYVQVLGGMGFSWESDAHLYLKRARRLVSAYGRTVPGLRRSLGDEFIAGVLAEGAAA